MAAEITIRTNGKAEFAHTGSKNEIWHKLGVELTPGASIETWIIESGLDWKINKSTPQFCTVGGMKDFSGKQILSRSDTYEPLSIVSDDYKVVQPGQVLEFFRDLTTLHGMELSCAGSLFGGKKFWATASIGSQFEAAAGDLVNGYLLLVTSADGTMATSAKLSSIRTICNNTLTAALADNQKIYKTSHRKEWDPEAVKLDMGLVSKSWVEFSKNIKRLAEIPVTDNFVKTYFQKKFYTPDVLVEDQSPARIKEVSTLIDLYNSGAGAEYSKGSLWGILNAVTDSYSNGTKPPKDLGKQFFNSNFGRADSIKSDVFEDLMKFAMAA